MILHRHVENPFQKDASRPCEAAQTIFFEKLSAGNFFQQLLIDIEVRVDVLHVIVVFERFDQANHLRGRRAFQLDVILRNHGDARGDGFDAGFLHRFEDSFIG